MTEPIWRSEFRSCLENVLNRWKVQPAVPSAERVLGDLLEEIEALSKKDSEKEEVHE